ncbi:nucleotidyltransferase family protein [Desulfallas thermosapovorans]|uniref:MobA-like NTP transferase protein n=1 Tax=Desulfallas thermosapovorans DSM 6562 TaxID=1121431 RepID=A0A5S4ZVP1_9FIRM|nr:nucleotidyltransferase family protein [Desulfallas thermosapovorans]TYO96982.1 MobA-like NTP transferase protein [Desulfallas thermosapovorans DSM 6562]
MIDALVLAGSPNDGPLKECSSARYEAMIDIKGKLMVEYVVDALKKCDRIDRIAIVGPRRELAERFNGGGREVLVEHVGNLTDNVLRGLGGLPGAKRVLLLTSDIPLITTRAIENFIDLCGDRQADLYYPVVPREVVEKIYTTSKRTYVQLKEGVYTGGNIFLFNPGVVEECLPRGQKLVDARKSPLKLCRLVGLLFLIKFLMKNISLQEAQKKVSRLLGIKGQVVISLYPEVGVDVDKPSDLELVNKQLELA